MAEVTGLVLGGIPVVLWALEQYRESVKSYWKYEESIMTLRDQLFVQREQLQATLNRLGLHGPSNDELQRILALIYPDDPEKRSIFLSIIRKMDLIILDLMQKLEINQGGQAREQFDSPDFIQEITLLYLPNAFLVYTSDTQLTWHLLAVVDHYATGACTLGMAELREWNDDLANCVGAVKSPDEEYDGKIQELQSQFVDEHCEMLRSDIHLIHIALDINLKCTCSSSHRTVLKMEWERIPPHLVKHFDIAMSFKQLNTSDTEIQAWGTFQAPLLQELPSILGNNLNHNLVESLCNELPRGSNATYALKLQRPTRQGTEKVILSQSPQNISDLDQLQTLRFVISSQSRVRLSSRQRYGLAAELAKTVLYLGNTPWIDAEAGLEQIKLFIERGSSGHLPLLVVPYLSYLFPASPPQGSQQSSYRFQSSKIHDKVICALGVCLIELCLNAQFEELKSSSVLGQVDDFDFAVHKLDDVYREAGDSYGYAVQRCLKFEFKGISPSRTLIYPAFRQTFHQNVVAPVQARYLRSQG
ncbi:MAG: hypothetical protein Q9160_008225 [Pyrenula sp. 1 TL-2023]